MPMATPTTPLSSRTFHVMAKPTGAICNLDCEYCFFLSKDQLYPGSGFRMEPSVHEAYLRQLLAAHEGADEVVVAFQGGEPTLMGLDFFRRTLELEQELRRPGQRILNTLQTNGTLLDDEWGAFLHEHGFLVGLSIDGPREMHDAYRVDKGGKPTYDRVVRGPRRAPPSRRRVERPHHRQRRQRRPRAGGLHVPARRARGPLHPAHPHRRARHRGPAPAGRGGLGRAPRRTTAVPPAGRPRHAPDRRRRAVRPVPGRRVRGVGEARRGRRVRPGVRHRARALDGHGPGRHVRPRPHLRVGPRARAQRRRLLLRPLRRGRLPARQPRRGTHAPPAGRPRRSRRAFGNAKLDTLPEYCRNCDVRFACNGGCPKDRFLTTPDGEPGLHYLCAGYQRFFRHVDEPMRVMAGLLRRGADATGVRDWYAANDATLIPDGGRHTGRDKPTMG